MASVRMRQAFKYPTEGDLDNDTPEGMDEQEQEDLIQDLATNDDAITNIYRRVFLIIPALASLLYITAVLKPKDAMAVSQALTSVTSLACTAYILYFKSLVGDESGKRKTKLGFAKQLPGPDNERGPIDKYIVYLNALLAIILAVNGYTTSRALSDDSRLSLGIIPGMVYLAILLVRWQLQPVDVSELEKLKYDYKGA